MRRGAESFDGGDLTRAPLQGAEALEAFAMEQAKRAEQLLSYASVTKANAEHRLSLMSHFAEALQAEEVPAKQGRLDATPAGASGGDRGGRAAETPQRIGAASTAATIARSAHPTTPAVLAAGLGVS